MNKKTEKPIKDKKIEKVVKAKVEKKDSKPKKEKIYGKKVKTEIKKEHNFKKIVEKNDGIIELIPVVTEKAVMSIETQNVLTFKTTKERTKGEIKKEVEDLFEVKVEKIKTHIRNNKKYAHVKLNKKFPAIDIATKLGII